MRSELIVLATSGDRNERAEREGALYKPRGEEATPFIVGGEPCVSRGEWKTPASREELCVFTDGCSRGPT